MRCLFPFLIALMLPAQESQFGVQSRLVLVPVTVTDIKGHLIDEIAPKDFAVLDNGRIQRISVDPMATGVAPIALVVAVQTSGISKAVLEKVRKVGALIQPVVTGESGCAALVAFDQNITWIQDCTNDSGAIEHAFEQVHTGEPKSARMLDAVYQSIERLRKHPNSRRALLLISESRDRSSDHTLNEISLVTQAAGVTVYAATYSAFKSAFTSKSSATGDPQPPKVPKTPSEQTGTMDGGPPHCGPLGCPNPPTPGVDQRVDILGGLGELVRMGKANTTHALTTATGGAAFPFTTLQGLEEAIQKLGSELHAQYLLSFTPDDSTPGYHRLEVRVASSGLRIRSRPGYWSGQAVPR